MNGKASCCCAATTSVPLAILQPLLFSLTVLGGVKFSYFRYLVGITHFQVIRTQDQSGGLDTETIGSHVQLR